MEKKYLQMEIVILENIKMGRQKAEESTFGRMEATTMETFKMELDLEMEGLLTKTKLFMKVISFLILG